MEVLKQETLGAELLMKYPERIAYLHFKNVDGHIKTSS